MGNEEMPRDGQLVPFDFIFLWLSGFKAKLYMSQKRKSHGKSELLLSDSMLAHFFKKK